MAKPDDVRRRQRGSSQWRRGLGGPKPDEPIDPVEWQAHLDRQRQERVDDHGKGLDFIDEQRPFGVEGIEQILRRLRAILGQN